MKRLLPFLLLLVGCEPNWMYEQRNAAYAQAKRACNKQERYLIDFRKENNSNTYVYRCSPNYSLRDDTNKVEK